MENFILVEKYLVFLRHQHDRTHSTPAVRISRTATAGPAAARQTQRDRSPRVIRPMTLCFTAGIHSMPASHARVDKDGVGIGDPLEHWARDAQRVRNICGAQPYEATALLDQLESGAGGELESVFERGQHARDRRLLRGGGLDLQLHLDDARTVRRRARERAHLGGGCHLRLHRRNPEQAPDGQLHDGFERAHVCAGAG
ncbi:hypothetical protein Ctob_002885 [Chrysochromulina tobinii]|uniref:Uncharacterized protein n=1 Tax=Chrysochromulina tobinii TaxID=1460289 RepID=A0A0M0J9M9_9EUKA|nr:hypothetical protein Ctob_002885 [Chrysochromulina tobinii]|eukprot:KOO23200.1 hypothetical protein Ctob_002885 [Chrysochromulina sp. CCMP291]